MPRKLAEQVVVITGASSGIGRETALLFARNGASVVLAARNEEGLRSVAAEIEGAGGQAQVVVTDVAQWSQVERLAQQAVDRFGRIDTWVNNAGISQYGTVEEATIEELERIIQVNLMGQIYGMKAALPHLKQRGEGTIINVSSGLGARAVPLQVAYCASKFAINGFTEGFRMELDRDKSNINLTVVLPSSVNTPLFNHARSRLGVKPMPIPLVYEPKVVAEAIVFAAEHPRRDIYAGGVGKLLQVLERLSPAFVDWYLGLGGAVFRLQKTTDPASGRDNLFEPIHEAGSTRGDFGKLAAPRSVYTSLLELHPNRKRVLLGATLAGAVVLLRRGKR